MNELQHVGQLESLKYRMNQLIESIAALQYLIHNNGSPAMPSWPDVLARYNLLLSQIHALFSALSYIPTHAAQKQQPQEDSQEPSTKPLQNLVVYPTVLFTQHQLDHELQHLFRTSQTAEVLKEEDGIVRRIGSMLKSSTPEGVPLQPGPEGCMQVVQECAEIKHEHDARVERAVKAVTLLKDRYDWHARVEANDVPENEEGEGEGGDAGPKEELRTEAIDAEVTNDTDVIMDMDVIPPAESTSHNEIQNDRNSEASTPPSARSDAINEASVTEAVLGESGPALG